MKKELASTKYKLSVHVFAPLVILSFLAIPCQAKVNPADIWTSGTGVQAMSMGQTYTAQADNYSAAHWNPAGLAKQTNRTIGSEVSNFFGDVQLSSLDCILPNIYGGTIAIGIANESVSDIPHTAANANDHANLIDYYSDKKTGIGLSYASSINNNLDYALKSR